MPIEEYDGVIINKVTLAKYKELKAANQLVASQSYVITDLDKYLFPNLLVLEDETEWVNDDFSIEISNDNIITINNSVNLSDGIYERFGRLNLPAGTYKFGAIVKSGTCTSTQYNYTMAVSYGGHDYEVYPWADDYEPREFTLDQSTEIRIAFWCDANMTFDNLQLELSLIKENNLIADLSNTVARVDDNSYWKVREGRVIPIDGLLFFNQNAVDLSSLSLDTILVTLTGQNGTVVNLKLVNDNDTYKLNAIVTVNGAVQTLASGSSLESMSFTLEYMRVVSTSYGYFMKISYVHDDVLNIIDNIIRINNCDF